MSKILSVLLAITLVISTNGPVFAAFTVDGSATFSASAVVGGTSGITVPFSAALKNISDDSDATSLGWGAIIAGTTDWLAANQYIAVQGFATYADWGIQIYTDNTNYTGTGDPAGLVREDNTLYSLPMCWRTKTDKLATGSEELEIYQGESGGYTVLYDGVSGHEPGGTDEYFPWFFMMDKGTPDVDPGTAGDQPYGDYQAGATFIGSAGYQHAPATYATPPAADATYYLYMGGCYTQAAPGATYSTSSITVEMYHL